MMCVGVAAIALACKAQTSEHASGSPQAAVTLIEQARGAAAAGRFADAIADYREALRVSPRNLDAEIGFGAGVSRGAQF